MLTTSSARPKLPSEGKPPSNGPGGRPSSSNVLTKILSPATLHLSIENPLIFLNPRPPTSDFDDPSSVPQHDHTLDGTVTLRLLKPRDVKTILVGLRVHSSLYFPASSHAPHHPHARTLLYSRDAEVRLDETLGAGDHSFEWSFVVPATMATFERGPYGSIVHEVKAKAKGPGLIGDIATEPLIWAPVGNPKLEESGERSADNERSVDGPQPGSLDIRFEDHSPHLGPYVLKWTSNNITISGLLSFSILFLCPPSSRVSLCTVTCHVFQHFSLHPESSSTVSPPPQKLTVFSLDGHSIRDRAGPEGLPEPAAPVMQPTPPRSPPASFRSTSGPPGSGRPLSLSPPPLPSTSQTISRNRTRAPSGPAPSPASSPSSTTHRSGPAPPIATLNPGEPLEIKRLARLPDDSKLRPSTLPGTITPLRVRHTLSVNVVYEVREEGWKVDKKALEISRPVQIMSCWCLLETLSLPAYSEGDPNPDIKLDPAHRDAARMLCVCGRSMEQLLRTEDPTPLAASGSSTPPASPDLARDGSKDPMA